AAVSLQQRCHSVRIIRTLSLWLLPPNGFWSGAEGIAGGTEFQMTTSGDSLQDSRNRSMSYSKLPSENAPLARDSSTGGAAGRPNRSRSMGFEGDDVVRVERSPSPPPPTASTSAAKLSRENVAPKEQRRGF